MFNYFFFMIRTSLIVNGKRYLCVHIQKILNIIDEVFLSVSKYLEYNTVRSTLSFSELNIYYINIYYMHHAILYKINRDISNMCYK